MAPFVVDLSQPAPRLPSLLFPMNSCQKEKITVLPFWWLKNSYKGHWMPCKEAECVEYNPYFHSGNPEWRGAFKRYRQVAEHEHGDVLMWDNEDYYWSCPHRTCFFGNVKEETVMYADGTPYLSWYDIYEMDLEAKKAAAAKRGEVFVEKKSEMIVHLEKLENDEEYKESHDIGAWLNGALTDKKRSAGKTWALDEAKICKYAARIHWNEKGKQEKVITYEYAHPFLNRKAKHFHAECWMWEYTDPKTKKAMAPRTCNCLHPGQAGWDDKWLVDSSFAYMYDRFEDWWKYTYHKEEKRWVYDSNRTKDQADRIRSKGSPQKAEAPKAATKPATKSDAKADAKAKAKSSSDDGWHTVLTQDARATTTHQTVWETAAGRGKGRK
jgi:hypothetical protein